MANAPSKLTDALLTPHPARPQLVLGGAFVLYGLFRSGLGGLITLGAGGALILKGMDEMRRIDALHGGNAHGVNNPPIKG